MLTGANTISVRTSEGTSPPIPFHCRSLGENRIYFESRLDGNDSFDGLSDHFNSGIHGPWRTATKLRNSVKAGDVIYFRGNGTPIWNEDDGGWGNRFVFNFWSGNPHQNGTVNNSISLSSYPGEMAQIGDGSTVNGWAVNSYDNILTIVNYWTLSKFFIYGRDCSVCSGKVNSNMANDHIRFIGNDMTTSSTTHIMGSVFTHEGGIGNLRGTTNLAVYGNYLHDAGGSSKLKVYNLYFGAYGFLTHIDIGWNEISHSQGGRGAQFFCHTTTDHMEDLKFHDNWVHDNAMTGTVFGGGDGGTGTDGTDSHLYSCMGNLFIYNNIYSRNGWMLEDKPAFPNIYVCNSGWHCDWGYGTPGTTYYIYHNTFYQGALGNIELSNDGTKNYGSILMKNNISYNTTAKGHFLLDRGTPSPCLVTCLGSGTNLYYGSNSLPVREKNSLINTDPQFINSNPGSSEDFELKTTSPAIHKGTPIPLIRTDFNGSARSKNPTIGSFETGK